MQTIRFDAVASAPLISRGGTKLRVEISKGLLKIRPTDRKAGPHVLTEIERHENHLLTSLTDDQLEQLNGGLKVDQLYHIEVGKHGWFSIVPTEDGHEGIGLIKVEIPLDSNEESVTVDDATAISELEGSDSDSSV